LQQIPNEIEIDHREWGPMTLYEDEKLVDVEEIERHAAFLNHVAFLKSRTNRKINDGGSLSCWYELSGNERLEQPLPTVFESEKDVGQGNYETRDLIFVSHHQKRRKAWYNRFFSCWANNNGGENETPIPA
jgi:hypothetical protein